jgi:Short chain fatty acid transporter
MADSHGKHVKVDVATEGLLARTALRFTAFTEKWLPDAFGFVLVGTFVVLAFGLVDAWGIGFWSLITFTLQMARIIIGVGVVLRFPLYGGIFGMIAYTGISARPVGWCRQATSSCSRRWSRSTRASSASLIAVTLLAPHVTG